MTDHHGRFSLPILHGAEDALGAAVVDALLHTGGEVRAFLDGTVAARPDAALRARGCKVAVGELDDAKQLMGMAHSVRRHLGDDSAVVLGATSGGKVALVGVFAAMADKDVRGMLEALEPVLAEVVVTASTSGRAMPADDLAAIAVEVFGDDRVEVTPRLDDAIDSAVSLAEEEGDLGGSGVLVTGSIVTVVEARTLLGLGDR